MRTPPSCPMLRDLLAMHDREAAPALTDALDEHLARCTTCRNDRHADDALLVELYDEAEAMDVERLARGHVRLRAALQARRPARRRLRWVLSSAAATLVLVLLAGWIGEHLLLARGDRWLARAIAAEQRCPRDAVRSARVRLRPSSSAAPFNSWEGSLHQPGDLPPAVLVLLDGYGSPPDVLRSAHFKVWRRSLGARSDVLLEGGPLRVLRTMTTSHETLRGAELVMEADSDVVVGVTLLGPDYRVEFTPLDGATHGGCPGR